MIEKVRHHDIGFLESKYEIDKFHNPYLSKFTLKLTPTTISNEKNAKTHIISPFDPTNYLYISQSLPIYKSQKFRASLVWKQSIQKKMGRGFIGLSSEYRAENMWTLKARAMFGSMFLYNLEVTKKLSNKTEAIVFHHGMYDNSIIAPIIGTGFKGKEVSATLHRRFGLDYNMVLQYTKTLPKGLFLCAKSEISQGELFEPSSLTQQNTLSVDYYFNHSIRARAGVTHVTGEKEVNPKFEVEKALKSFGNFIFNIEYKNNASILSFGYKNPTLNLVLPVMFFDSPIPTLVAAVAYVVGYFTRKRTTEVIEIKKKEEEVRVNELKLISDKGNANYEKERSLGERGLLIEEAFVGPSMLLDQLIELPERGVGLLRDNDLKNEVFDITVCLRFYVIKGELKLKKGDKSHLLGFYCNNSDDEIIIKYHKGGETKEIRVKMTDEIFIH